MQNYNSKSKIKHTAPLRLSDFDYNLPKNLIATKPHEPRDKCRLLVFDRMTGQIKHTRFDKILDFLKAGDVLVLNDTKVIPARLIGRRIAEGGEKGHKFKVLLLTPFSSPLCKGESKDRFPLYKGKSKRGLWQVLIDGKKRRVGLKIDFGKGLVGEAVGWLGNGKWEMKFNRSGRKFWDSVFELGKMPLPPYIKQVKDLSRQNKIWYQTVYAKEFGSVAAPTAGLHFTHRLLRRLNKRGIKTVFITLHVGLGTFAPVKVEEIKKHKMEAEYFELSYDTAKRLNQAKKEGRRIIACGTTTARVLEYCSLIINKKQFQTLSRSSRTITKVMPQRGYTDLFIYPPYKFKFVDALITNFHLPKSTLLMLVTAFVGAFQNLPPEKSLKIVKKIYKEAIDQKYKFYSYGDAMLIL